MLNSLKPLSHLIPATALWGQYYYNCFIKKEEIEAQRVYLLSKISKTAPSNRNIMWVTYVILNFQVVMFKKSEKKQVKLVLIIYFINLEHYHLKI